MIIFSLWTGSHYTTRCPAYEERGMRNEYSRYRFFSFSLFFIKNIAVENCLWVERDSGRGQEKGKGEGGGQCMCVL